MTVAPNTPAWDDGTWRALPALSGNITADVCVIGLGGSGLSCVRELTARGKRVVGIDAGQVGGGAAGRNGGFLLAGTQSFHHDTIAALGADRARAIYELTLREIDRIAHDASGSVRCTGSLRIAVSDVEYEDCERQLAAMRADDMDVAPYEGPEGRGLLFPRDCSFQPLARCRTLAGRAIEEGASLFEQTCATDIATGAVVTDNGIVSCDAVIVAVDGRLESLVPELAGRVRTARLQMLGTAPVAETLFSRPVYANWGYDYWQQLPDGRVLLGGARDRFIESEWSSDASPTDIVQDSLETMLRDALHVSAAITHRWAASVSYTEEELPVLEQVRPHVWAIGAYNGTGNVMGSLYGRMVAALATRGESELAQLFFGDARATSSRESAGR